MDKASWDSVISDSRSHSPMQVLEAFSQRFRDATESDLREFAQVVHISPTIVNEFLGTNKSEDAEIFWQAIGNKGRSMYIKSIKEDLKYVEYRWEDIPRPIRVDLSKEMNLHYRSPNLETGSWKKPVNESKDKSMKICDACRGKGKDSDGKKCKLCYGAGILASWKSKSKLNSLILGIVAGAGGVIAGSLLRQHLISRGISENRVDPAIQNALAMTYRIHDQRRRLVRKDDLITFITFNSEDNSVMNTVNKLNPTGMVDNDEALKIGESVTYGQDGGRIVSVTGNYATILKDDGNTELMHIKALMRTSDIIYTKDTGMTTWNLISAVEKSQILNNCNLPANYISKQWIDMIPIAKKVIQEKYGRIVTKEQLRCTGCDEGFTTSDPKELADHKESHKNKLDKDDRCRTCYGSGYTSDGSSTCHTCNGSGKKKTIINKEKLKCAECGKIFYDDRDLADHQAETGHSGWKGKGKLISKDAGTSDLITYNVHYICQDQPYYKQIEAIDDQSAIRLLQQFINLEYPEMNVTEIKITESNSTVAYTPIGEVTQPRVVFHKEKYHYHRIGRDKDKVKPEDERTDANAGRENVSENGTGQDYQSQTKDEVVSTTTSGMSNPVHSDKKPKKKVTKGWDKRSFIEAWDKDSSVFTPSLAHTISDPNMHRKRFNELSNRDQQIILAFYDVSKAEWKCPKCGTRHDSKPNLRNGFCPDCEDYQGKGESEKWTIHGITQVVGKAQCQNCRCIIKDGSDRCPDCNAIIGGLSKMREQTDLTQIAREANENFAFDDADENEKPNKPKKAPKPDKVETPAGTPNNNNQSSQRYEA